MPQWEEIVVNLQFAPTLNKTKLEEINVFEGELFTFTGKDMVSVRAEEAGLVVEKVYL